MRLTCNRSEAVGRINRGEDFDAGNFWGKSVAIPAMQTGYLPHAWRQRFVADRPLYVVWSYGTPIGWTAEDGRHVVPFVNYSSSTGRHQTAARQGWGVNPNKLRELAPYELEVAA